MEPVLIFLSSLDVEIMELKTLKGLALQDVLREVHGLTKRIVLPAGARMFLLDEMSKIEYVCIKQLTTVGGWPLT